MGMTTIAGEALPAIGLGTWRMGESTRERQRDVDAVALALRIGCRVVDTAEMYGEGGAERVVGEALKQAQSEGIARASVFVVSKAYPQHGGGPALLEACAASLARLGLEQLDLYLLHWRGSIPLADTVRGMEDLRRRGLVRHWGVSNFDVADMEELVAIDGGAACAANQIYFSLGERGAGHSLLPWLERRGMLAMAYSPVDQGSLAADRGLLELARPLGLSAAQLALAWVLQHGGTMAIPKAVQAAHLRENLAAASITLAPELLAELDRRFPPPRHKPPLAMT